MHSYLQWWCLFAGNVWRKCKGPFTHGAYVWTAGERENIRTRSKFVWKPRKHYPPEEMNYTNWHRGHAAGLG